MAKKTDEPAIPKKKNLEVLMKAINKKYGAGTIVTAGRAIALEIPRIPSGSFGLDCELGGGWPRGRISLVVGPYSVGKSFVAYLAVAEAQKMFPNETPIWIDQEGVFEASWAAEFGIIVASDDEEEAKNDPINALRVVRPDSAESALDITLEFFDCPGISIIIYDSLAANSPKDEIEGSMEDWTMGLAARLNNKFFRKGQAILNIGSLEQANTKPAIIILNQLRKTMDKYKPEVIPGGEGQGFFSSIIVWLRRGETFVESRGSGKPEEYVGHEINFKTEKNKTFPPKRNGSFDIYVTQSEDTGYKAGQVDRLKEVVTYAIHWDVIRKGGAWFYIDGIEKPFQGADKMLDFLRESPEHMQAIEAKVLALAVRKVNKHDPGGATFEDEKGRIIETGTGVVLFDPGEEQPVPALPE
jgi:recombination protein RecA